MSANYELLIECIINEYAETADGYKDFLNSNVTLLQQVFMESKSDNLRTFKSILADFERVYTAWKESGITTDNMKWALYTFASGVFISKEPPQKDRAQPNDHNPYSSKHKEEQYANRGKNRSSFSSFNDWIHDGIWDRNSFIRELRVRYTESEQKPAKRFLLNWFWSLEQKDIDEGLPDAIDLAYKGGLSQENLIYLLTKIHNLREYSIELPCEVSYHKMEEGLRQRIQKIKAGELIEPRCHTFAEYDQMDEEAHQLYKMARRLNDQIVAWDYRRLFIEYISAPFDSLGFFQRGYMIDEFDKDLLNLFIERFSDASNGAKKEYANALMGLVFDSTSCSTTENMIASKENFMTLVEWLQSKESHDTIETIIIASFIRKINIEIVNPLTTKIEESKNKQI